MRLLSRNSEPEGPKYWHAKPGEKLTRADREAGRVSWLEAPHQKKQLQREGKVPEDN